MPDYSNDPVLQKLLAAKSGIGDQVSAALAEIGRQETQGQQSVANYQPTLDSIYAGIPEAGAKPSLNILKAAQSSTAPLMSMGFQDTANRRRGGLEQARLLEIAALDKEQATYMASREAEARQRAHEAQQAAQERAARAQDRASTQRAERDPIADYEAKILIDQKHGVGDYAPKEPTPQKQTLDAYLKSMSGSNTSADRGAALLQGGGALLKGIQQSPDYRLIESIISDGKVNFDDISRAGDNAAVKRIIGDAFRVGTGDPVASLLKWLGGQGKHRSSAVLSHLYGGTTEDRDARTSTLLSSILG